LTKALSAVDCYSSGSIASETYAKRETLTRGQQDG
jgi:hypothetical protein